MFHQIKVKRVSPYYYFNSTTATAKGFSISWLSVNDRATGCISPLVISTELIKLPFVGDGIKKLIAVGPVLINNIFLPFFVMKACAINPVGSSFLKMVSTRLSPELKCL